jgi:high-affinity nickel permease
MGHLGREEILKIRRSAQRWSEAGLLFAVLPYIFLLLFTLYGSLGGEFFFNYYEKVFPSDFKKLFLPFAMSFIVSIIFALIGQIKMFEFLLKRKTSDGKKVSGIIQISLLTIMNIVVTFVNLFSVTMLYVFWDYAR